MSIDLVFPELLKTVADTVYAMNLPQDATYPAVVIQRIGEVESVCMDGPTGVVTHMFNLTCWGRSYEDVRDLTEGIRDLVSGYQESTDDEDLAIFLVDSNDNKEYVTDNLLYREVIRVKIWTNRKLVPSP